MLKKFQGTKKFGSLRKIINFKMQVDWAGIISNRFMLLIKYFNAQVAVVKNKMNEKNSFVLIFMVI